MLSVSLSTSGDPHLVSPLSIVYVGLNSITSICQYLPLMMFMFMAVVPMPVMVSMAFRYAHLVLVAHHHNNPQALVSHSILCRGRRCHVLPLSAAVRQVEGSVVQKVVAVFDFTERKHKARPRHGSC